MEKNSESSGESVFGGRITIFRMDKIENSFYSNNVYKDVKEIESKGYWFAFGDETLYIPFHAITKIKIREDRLITEKARELEMYQNCNN
jgi:uncharacterized protein (UPF0248 family)